MCTKAASLGKAAAGENCRGKPARHSVGSVTKMQQQQQHTAIDQLIRPIVSAPASNHSVV